MDESLYIASYNSRGSSENKLKFINDIANSHDLGILCVQKHFLLKKNLRKLSNAINNKPVIGKAAYKSSSFVDRSRPRGGLAIIVPEELRSYTKAIEFSSLRLQGISVIINGFKYVIINVYLPVDS